MALELFQFQQDAASQMADRYVDYDARPVVMGRRGSEHEVPFYQALSSITGSGKTAILAQAVRPVPVDVEERVVRSGRVRHVAADDEIEVTVARQVGRSRARPTHHR